MTPRPDDHLPSLPHDRRCWRERSRLSRPLPGEHHAARLLLLAEPRRQRHDSFPFLTCSEKNKCHNVARRAADLDSPRESTAAPALQMANKAGPVWACVRGALAAGLRQADARWAPSGWRTRRVWPGGEGSAPPPPRRRPQRLLPAHLDPAPWTRGREGGTRWVITRPWRRRPRRQVGGELGCGRGDPRASPAATRAAGVARAEMRVLRAHFRSRGASRGADRRAAGSPPPPALAPGPAPPGRGGGRGSVRGVWATQGGATGSARARRAPRRFRLHCGAGRGVW